MARTIKIDIVVPDDYDTEPMMHRITEWLEGIKGEASEFEDVPEDVICHDLKFFTHESR